MSLAVLTDSTTAQASPALTFRPTAGSSTNTTSVNSCWAWSVMPIVPMSPVTRSHSWDLANFKSLGTWELIVLSFGPDFTGNGRGRNENRTGRDAARWAGRWGTARCAGPRRVQRREPFHAPNLGQLRMVHQEHFVRVQWTESMRMQLVN